MFRFLLNFYVRKLSNFINIYNLTILFFLVLSLEKARELNKVVVWKNLKKREKLSFSSVAKQKIKKLKEVVNFKIDSSNLLDHSILSIMKVLLINLIYANRSYIYK